MFALSQSPRKGKGDNAGSYGKFDPAYIDLCLADPIEAGAIADAFQSCISPDRPLYVGSVKSNVGHLEGTSGIAGIIKSVLMLEQGTILPIAGLEVVNPSILQDHPALKVRTHNEQHINLVSFFQN